MTFLVFLRPMALGSCAAVCAVTLAQSVQPASAQQYGAPTRYGTPYAPPPSMAGAKSTYRPLDNTYRPPVRTAPYPAYERPGIWNGLYIGGHGAFAVGTAEPSSTYGAIDLSGGSLGVHGGYNWQMGDWVLGLEGDAAWSRIDGRRSLGAMVGSW